MKPLPVILIFILIMIFFVPVPIKIIFKYKINTKPEIFFYNIKIKPQNKKRSKKSIKYLKNLYPVIKDSKFKFGIDLSIKFIYDLEDSAAVGILCGFLWSFYALFYKILPLFFKVKNINYEILPKFNNKKYLNLNINCIFFVSLAKVIYMGFYILKYNYKSKKFNPSKI